MSPRLRQDSNLQPRFPRVSGDEPAAFGAMTDLYMFFPA